MTNSIPKVTIPATGCQIPIIGFGSGTKWRIEKTTGDTKDQFIQVLADQISNAIQTGYTHIDTAEAYFTHPEVGQGIMKSGVPRSELWVTDKYNPSSFQWRKSTGPLDSLQRALGEINLEYVDLYMLHRPDINVENAGLTLREAWIQMEELYEKGLAKNIGVSNFSVENLKYLEQFAKIMPMVNQIEFNPYLQEQSPGIINYCKEKGIVIAAYSPLSPLNRARPGPLDAVLPDMEKKYGLDESLLLLRWAIQNGVVVLTTSSKQERLLETLKVLDFELEDDDFKTITSIGREKIYRWCCKALFDKYNDKLYSST